MSFGWNTVMLTEHTGQSDGRTDSASADQVSTIERMLLDCGD